MRPNVTESKWIIQAGDGDPWAHSLNDSCVISCLHNVILTYKKAFVGKLEQKSLPAYVQNVVTVVWLSCV